VDLYLALSEFAKAKFVSAGFAADRIVVKPNFVSPDRGMGSGDGRFALFVGRLTPEKGIGTLLNAWRQINGRLPLRIVGEGALQEWVAHERIEGMSLLGRQSPSDTLDLMGQSTVVIVPSEWHEPFGRVIVEAFSRGTPVIAARVGGIAELVEDGKNGFLFTPSDSSDLAEKVRQFVKIPLRHSAMRMAARQSYLQSYTAQANIAALRSAYKTAIQRHAMRGGGAA
jgi:glycosyltransferase involved in cell wall biosynthesis